MAQIEQFVAPIGGVHTQKLDTQTGTQASGKDFYAINQTFSQAGAINFDPLVKGLAHAAGALENKVESDAKIWAYEMATQGKFDFDKRVAAGESPSSLSNSFQAWQAKMSKDAPSGLANSLFLRHTDEIGRSMVIAGIRQDTAARQQAATQALLKTANNEYGALTDSVSDGTLPPTLEAIGAKLRVGATGIAETANPASVDRNVIEANIGSHASPSDVLPNGKLRNGALLDSASLKILLSSAEKNPDPVISEFEKGDKSSYSKLPIAQFNNLKNVAYSSRAAHKIQGATNKETSIAMAELKTANIHPEDLKKIEAHFNSIIATQNAQKITDPASVYGQNKEVMDVNKSIMSTIKSGDMNDPNVQKQLKNLNNYKTKLLLDKQAEDNILWSDQRITTDLERSELQASLQNNLSKGDFKKVMSTIDTLKSNSDIYFSKKMDEIMYVGKGREKKLAVDYGVSILDEARQMPWFADFTDSLNPALKEKRFKKYKDTDVSDYFESDSGWKSKESAMNLIQGSPIKEIQKEITNYAEHLFNKPNAPASIKDALKTATTHIISELNHEVEMNGNTVLIPKSVLPNYNDSMRSAMIVSLSEAMSKDNPAQIKFTRSGTGVKSFVMDSVDYIHKVHMSKNSFFVPSPTRPGMFLMYVDNGNGNVAPVYNEKGKIISRTTDDFNKLASVISIFGTQ